MLINTSINRFRRIVMHTLTSGIGDRKSFHTNTTNVHKIMVSRPNSRLGNQLLITPLLQELSDIFPEAQIDLFVRGGLAPILFQNYTNIDTIFKLPGRPFEHLISYFSIWLRLIMTHYDLAINAESGSSSGRLSVKFAHAKYKVYDLSDNQLEKLYSDYRHMAKHPVYTLRKLLDRKIDLPIHPLSIKLNSKEKEYGKKFLQQFVGNSKKTICLYTYATGNKCYSKDLWRTLYAKLHEHFDNNYNIIEILPKENISQLDFTIPHFYSTEIRNLAGLLSASDFFISADCGMMHLATASEVPTIGLFSTTNRICYEPYGPKNVGINTHETFISKIITHIDAGN